VYLGAGNASGGCKFRSISVEQKRKIEANVFLSELHDNLKFYFGSVLTPKAPAYLYDLDI